MADSTCRVLYIEDAPEDSRLLEEAIRASGVPVTLETAAQAEQAARLIASGARFDVVLLDWNLPGRTGMEVLRDIRSARPRIPVFVLTGLPVSVAAAEVEGEVETVIAKPFTMDTWEDLARLLATFCGDIGALPPSAALIGP